MQALYRVIPNGWISETLSVGIESNEVWLTEEMAKLVLEQENGRHAGLSFVRVEVERVKQALVPDIVGIQHPNLSRIRPLHQEPQVDDLWVWKNWSKTNKSWPASAKLVGTVRCMRSVAPALLAVVSGDSLSGGAADGV